MRREFVSSRRVVPILIVFCAGVLLGVVLGHRNRPAALSTVHEQASPTPVLTGRSEPIAAPRPIAPPATKPPEYLSRLKVLSELNAMQQNKFLAPVIMGEKLNDDFAAVFGLTPSATDRLRSAIAGAKLKLAELEADHAKVERSGDGEFTVTIPVFPAEGGAVYDDLMRTIRETLGEQRLPYYETIGQYDFERSSEFGQFGLTQSTIRVTQMRDEHGNPTSTWEIRRDRSNGGVSKLGVSDPNHVKRRYPLIYQKLLDAGFVEGEP